MSDTNTVALATIDDVERLAKQIKDNWTLCRFLNKGDAEVMIVQTIHAAATNAEEHGEPFAFRGADVPIIGQGVNNAAGYQMLLDQGLIIEDERLGKPVIFPTAKLVKKLDGFLA